MVILPYISVHNMVRQFRAALLLRKTTGWKHFPHWVRTNGIHSIPVAAGAVGMGCIGFGVHAVWEVTEACNLRCRHCHATSSTASPDELDTREGYAFLDQLSALKGFQMLAYSGGEPLVRPDINDLLAYTKKKGLVSVIATNGTLIDDARARELVKLGVKGIAVSFDSTDPAIHNAIRQSPTAFDRALRGIEACKKAGMVIQLNYTAMKENVDTLPSVIRFAHDIHADIMLCYQLVPMGRGGAIAQSALSPEQNRKLVNTVRTLQKDAVTVVEPVAAPQYWAHLLGRDNLDPKDTIKGGPFHGCAAGWGLIYVKPNGEVWPCPFVPVSGGNVRTTPLAEIHQKSDIFTRLSTRDHLKGKCGECDNRHICGGCRGKAYAVCGDPLEADPTCYLHNTAMPEYLKWEQKQEG
ncbi:MAG: radical SAM protein [Myxococcota bacterium]|jgi:radical SAM protein with 4Fe4S-binding SPASM domain